MAKQFRLTVVTPETTFVDEMVECVRIPLYDGMIGILPGRAPLVGRLGYGIMTIDHGPKDETWFLDGGFVQVAGDVVSILTDRAVDTSDLDPDEAKQRLAEAGKIVPNSPETLDAKERQQERARQIISHARS